MGETINWFGDQSPQLKLFVAYAENSAEYKHPSNLRKAHVYTVFYTPEAHVPKPVHVNTRNSYRIQDSAEKSDRYDKD